MLTSLLSTAHIFSMLCVKERIAGPKRIFNSLAIKQYTNNFFNSLCDKKFNEIQEDFYQLPPLAQCRTLYCCNNLDDCNLFNLLL